MDEQKARKIVLDFLKGSSTGIQPTELCKLAKEKGVENPLPVIKALTDEEILARLDKGKGGRPDRVKALSAAWD